MKTFYITTAIDYPNGTPHLGHAYEKVVTDFYARYHKLFNGSSYFLTGTDENGQKLIKSAQAASKETNEFVDMLSPSLKNEVMSQIFINAFIQNDVFKDELDVIKRIIQGITP